MEIQVNAVRLNRTCGAIISHIKGKRLTADNKHLADIIEEYSVPLKKLGIVYRFARKLTIDEAIEIADDRVRGKIFPDPWKSSYNIQRLNHAKSLRKACLMAIAEDDPALITHTAVVTINERDIQLIRWYESNDEWTSEDEIFNL